MPHRSSRLLSAFLFGVLALMLPLSSASAQTLDDAVRYSERLPAPGGPALGRSGAGLFVGAATPNTLFGNPAGLGWLSSSMLSGDFAVNRTVSDTRFSTPDANTSSDLTVSDYRLGSIAGAYSFPTTQGSLVIGTSFHQSNTYERGFDILGKNRTNSITGSFLPEKFQLDEKEEITFSDILSSIEGLLPRLAFEAGAIDFSKEVFRDEEASDPFFQGAAINDTVATNGEMVLNQQENLHESGQMNELSFGLATAIAPNVMLGGGLNIALGSYTFERLYRETEVSDLLPPENLQDPQPPYDPYFVVDSTSTPTLVLEGFNELQMEDRIEANLSGVNFRVGLSAEPTDALRVGVHVESPTWLTVNEVYGTEIQTQFDCDYSLNTPCPQGGVEGFSSGNLTGNEFTYEIRTPWRIGGGLQYSMGRLSLAGDATFIDWTQAEISAEDASFPVLNRKIQNLNATINTRVGLQYETEIFAVRTGIAFHPSTMNRSFEDIDGKTVNGDRLFLSAGASITLSENSSFHLNWMQERFDDQFQSYNSRSGPSPTVRESVTRNRFLLGLTYQY